MSHEMVQYGGGELYPADRRRAGRSVSRMQGSGAVRQSRMDVETDVTMNKLDNVTMATGSGMRAVITVAQAQQALEQMMPSASGRLAMLADDHALGVADVLADLRYRARRI
ncbi:hypothetical protein SAMN05443575_3689 [Jatrophihabitans endophyticus]|uniref:Uncharacterized protein n=1 Tax=Jatrophihabitans endophyticus TaxID=1206085 RepID=A0A1M5RYK6_9ACTN|nr:hypothetical protein [Jatrophihabitans endophyticus]SHH31326.1 hypothetical protein SAMN05443575_3689 [Jatrophihabitans endophyticus]